MRKTIVNQEYPASFYILLSKEYCIKGTLLADEGDLKEAMENFNKAVEVDPANPIAYFNRATVKVAMGDIEGARNDFFNFDRLKKIKVIDNKNTYEANSDQDKIILIK